MKRWRAALGWSLVGLAAASLLALAGSHWWLLDLLSHFRAHYALAALVLLPLAGLLRHRPLAALAGAVLVGNGLALLPAVWPGPSRTGPVEAHAGGGAELGVAVANVHQSNRDFSMGAALLEEHDPDVLGFLEVDEAWIAALDRALPEHRHRLKAPRSDHYGLALYSRLPLEEARLHELGPDRRLAAVARVRLDGRPVRLALFHAEAALTPATTRTRNAELAELAWLATRDAPSDQPLLVLGDLNVTPWSHAFRTLLADAGLRDSREGHGHHGSWPAWAPGLRIPIDHLLVSREWVVAERRLGPARGSDHLPVIARLRLGAGAPGLVSTAR